MQTAPAPTPDQAPSVKNRRDFLRSVELFARLPVAALDRLVLTFERQSNPEGAVVFRQGDRGDRMYLVEEGAVDLYRNDEYGRVHRLATIDAGGYFGELALLSDQPRAATAQCATRAELLTISGRDLKRLLTESPPALRSLIGNVGEYRPPDKPPPFWARLGRGKVARSSANGQPSAADSPAS